MKHIFKKNYIVISALAVMIAVAGYLNYARVGTSTTTVSNMDESELVEVASLDEEYPQAEAVTDEEVSANPGEAVLTSITTDNGYAAQARLSREQVRAKSKETLLGIIENDSVSEEEKTEAIQTMNTITDSAEREAAAEMLLEAKGYEGAVVSMTDGKADVVIQLSEITEVQRAQIEDIVKRKTEIPGANIVITPMNTQSEIQEEIGTESETQEADTTAVFDVP